MKPTSRRASSKLAANCGGNFARGQEHIIPILGPLAYCLDDVIFGTKMIFESLEKAKDPTVPPLKFDTKILEEYKTKERLNLGYYTYNQTAKCTEP